MIFFLKLIFTGFLLFYGISILFNYSIKNNYDSEDENKVYNITWVSQPINIDGFWNKEPWKNIPPLNIDKHIGNVPEHKPTVQAKVAYDNEAIYIIFRVQDKYVKCVTEQYQGSVYKDSCVEFFFTPGSDISKGYFNLACIIHQEIWLWARRPENGGGNVPEYVEQTIFETTQPTAKFRSECQYVE